MHKTKREIDICTMSEIIMKDHFNYVPSANSDTMIKIDYNLFYQLSIFDYYRLRMPGLNATLTSAKKTSETISHSSECYAGLSGRFDSSAACM